MNKATRLTTTLVAVYAGFLGMVHGYFSVLQGNVQPDGVMFNAVGAPCQTKTVYHACLPALTLMPNLFVSGILALAIGLSMILWAVFFLPKRHGGLVLIGLSLLLLLVGGGFLPAFTGIIVGVTGTRINTILSWWREHFSEKVLRLLGGMWPWSLVAYFVLVLGQGLLGNFVNALLLSMGIILLLFEYALLLLSIFAAFAHDIQKKG